MKYFYWLFCSALLMVSSDSLADRYHHISPHIYYVSFPSQTIDGRLIVSGQYRLPRRDNDTPIPAVVILHSSGGVDTTGSWYAKALNQLGIATLEIDMWSPRGLAGGTDNRPESVQQTIPDAYAALDFLASKSEIDADNIAVLGFSWGGAVAMLSATEPYYQLLRNSDNKFAAHIAHYPVCWTYNVLPGFEFSELTGAPVLIQIGAKDDYESDPNSCKKFVSALPRPARALVKVKTYRNGHHGWDRLEQRIRVFDVFGDRGKGSYVDLIPNKHIAKHSRTRVNQFITQHLLK